jgi:hypothetical protein
MIWALVSPIAHCDMTRCGLAICAHRLNELDHTLASGIRVMDHTLPHFSK